MDEDEVAMCMAGDIARHRRTDDFRRRPTKATTDDATTQTENGVPSADLLSESYTRMRKQTTVLCFMGFALVVANISQLRFALLAGEQHKHYVIVLFLLALSLVVQCFIALLLLYTSKREADKAGIEGYPMSIASCNTMVVLLTAVCVLNLSVFVLA